MTSSRLNTRKTILIETFIFLNQCIQNIYNVLQYLLHGKARNVDFQIRYLHGPRLVYLRGFQISNLYCHNEEKQVIALVVIETNASSSHWQGKMNNKRITVMLLPLHLTRLSL
jgi:hypothetical protein